MKILSAFLSIVLLLSCSPDAQEEENPLAGTTWGLTSGINVGEDTTITFLNSPYDQYILIFGKTHYNVVHQDTSQNVSSSESYMYNINGDNISIIPIMHPIYQAIGKTYIIKYQVADDRLIIDFTDVHAAYIHWKSGHHVWKRID